MSAVLSPADRNLAAGIAGAVTMEDEPAKAVPTFAIIYADGINISVQDYKPGSDATAVLLDAYMLRGPHMQTKVGIGLHLTPAKALELATALMQSASRLIAAQDAAGEPL